MPLFYSKFGLDLKNWLGVTKLLIILSIFCFFGAAITFIFGIDTSNMTED